MITDIKIADRMLCIAPDIRIWSARCKMRAEDYGIDAANLPPDDVASLGVKKLCPQEKLRPFAMLKSRAVSLLSRHGVPFLPGSWLVPADQAASINTALAEIQTDFNAAKESFMAEYDDICRSWSEQHPGYEEMLRNSMASPNYVSSHISFGWKAFALKMTKNSNIREEMEHLADSVFEDIAKSAKTVQREVFLDKEVVTQKALRPIATLHAKLRDLSFVHPQVANAASLTQSCLEAMPAKGNIEGAHLGMVFALLTLLSSPTALEDATSRMAKGKADCRSLLIPTPVAATEPTPVPVPPKRTIIENVGLW